jgi:tetratricopeptide (TPR) repeat protein
VDNQESKARILHSIGINYKWLNKLEDAQRHFQDSLAIEESIGDKRGMAATLDQIAQVQDLMGKPELAKQNYLKATKIEREIGDKKGLAGSLLNLGTFYYARGRYDEALESTKEAFQLYTELGDENRQALCLSNIGAYYVAQGQFGDGITYYQRALQLRERLKIPGEMAETLYNLGDAYAQSARYDEALDHYMRALQLWRSVGNKEGVAVASTGMGTLFTYQGRFGAALSAQEEALKTIRELQQRNFWLGEILAGYGNALSLVGRGGDAEKPLEEALALARELGNEPLVAKVLNYQGDRYFYAGDSKSARALYDQALQMASRTQDRQVILLSKLNRAKLAVKEEQRQAAYNTLKSLGREADGLSLKYLSAECSLYMGEALLTDKKYARARGELELTLRNSEKLNLRVLQARAHFLLAKALAAGGDESAASRHSQKARELLEEMRKEAGTDALLQRSDLKPIHAETARAAPPTTTPTARSSSLNPATP